MIEVRDDLGRWLELRDPARRIACLVPSITETLFALGAGDSIVAITDYCIHPKEGVRTKKRIGGTKNFAATALIKLEPDLVIANAEENRRHQVQSLEDAGLKLFVTFPKTVDGCLKMIADMGAVTGTGNVAQTMLSAIEKACANALSLAPARPPRVLCPIWKNPYMTINRDTYVDSVIRCCGGANLFTDAAERYPHFSLNEAARRLPEVVILPTEPYHFTEADKPDFREMGDEVPAVKFRRIHIVEGELLSWYGPRLARALREISALIREAAEAE